MLHLLKNFSAPCGKTTLRLLENGQRNTNKNPIRNQSGALKVVVVGAAGRIGRPLSLLLKQSPIIDELALYDKKPTCNFALELGHIDTKSKVAAYTGNEGIEPALKNARVVVCVAQKSKANAMNYAEALEVNGGVVKEIAQHFGRHCPKALFAIATQPVNSIVPMVSEELKRMGRYQSSAILGVSTLHTVRTNTFVADVLGIEPECVVVPVVGGNTGSTIVPVLSKAKPCAEFTREELVRITKAVQKADEDMMKVRTVRGATLSAAFAIARFVVSLVKGVRGYKNIVESAYVLGTARDQQTSKYLTTPVQLGPDGVMKNFGLPSMTDYEKCLFDNALTQLEKHIKGGELLAGINDPPPCDPCDADVRAPPCPPDWCEIRHGKKKHST